MNDSVQRVVADVSQKDVQLSLRCALRRQDARRRPPACASPRRIGRGQRAHRARGQSTVRRRPSREAIQSRTLRRLSRRLDRRDDRRERYGLAGDRRRGRRRHRTRKPVRGARDAGSRAGTLRACQRAGARCRRHARREPRAGDAVRSGVQATGWRSWSRRSGSRSSTRCCPLTCRSPCRARSTRPPRRNARTRRTARTSTHAQRSSPPARTGSSPRLRSQAARPMPRRCRNFASTRCRTCRWLSDATRASTPAGRADRAARRWPATPLRTRSRSRRATAKPASTAA